MSYSWYPQPPLIPGSSIDSVSDVTQNLTCNGVVNLPNTVCTFSNAGTTYLNLMNATAGTFSLVSVVGEGSNNGLQILETGTGPKQGVATLVAGTVLVNNTSVSATSRIFLAHQGLNGTTPTVLGNLYVSAVSPGTSFTITSSSSSDSSFVAYHINEPAVNNIV